MASRVAVLIGPQDLPASFESRPDTLGTVTFHFSDQQTREALDTVFDRHPDYLVLDKDFAATTRGKAIIGRIQGDTAFGDTRLLILPDTPASAIASPSWPGPAVDLRGTRRVPRRRVKPGTEVLVDGAIAQLIDLSTLGAQVISPTILKPNQRVRVSLPVPSGARSVATVAWALFELPKGRPAPQYRAGLEFANPDLVSLQQVLATLAVPGDEGTEGAA